VLNKYYSRARHYYFDHLKVPKRLLRFDLICTSTVATSNNNSALEKFFFINKLSGMVQKSLQIIKSFGLLHFPRQL